ncbi:MAG: helix-turn-helix transcriptional regulator [Candidatus Nanoarchaeia archaeon]
MSIYKLMEKNWKVYSLMAGIAFIEEMNKPTQHEQIKHNKKFIGYHTISFRSKNKDILCRWIKITRIWEKKLNQQFISSYFKEPKLEKGGKKWGFIFTPNWLYYITKTVGKFPSGYSNKIILKRLSNWKVSGNKNKYILTKEQINSILNTKLDLYNQLLKNKKLAAGAFIVSFDLEFRGLTIGRPDLCMSDTYKDFLKFMLKIANKWSWATNNKLYFVNVEYSRNLGIDANDQYRFIMKSQKVSEIYKLAGPVIDNHKDKCIKFHIKRVKNYINKGGCSSNTKSVILNKLKELGSAKSTELQFYSNVGIDVLLVHLNNLYKQGLINKERKGKYYLWSIKDGN